MKKSISIIIFLGVVQFVCAQTAVPFTSERWKFEAEDHRVETHLGKSGLRLKGGRATLPDVSFENGIIEYDIAFSQQRGFLGVSFRMQDNKNYEEFYVRPHQSGNPDANQYTPVYGGLAAWQLYYGEGYGAPVQYAFDEWTHVRLMISGQYMEVYIRDMEKPALFSELKRPVGKGYLGITNNGEGYFANFTYTITDNVQLQGTPKPKQPATPGTVTRWEVSTPVSGKDIMTATSLKPFEKGLSWKTVESENTGTVNLASVAEWSEENNTVLARVVVNADKDQLKKFVFGFSESARVYFNGNLLYSGEDVYRSRDYRFLGTIGYFDALYLNLKKGRNEITIAVTEIFGGWGVRGRFEDVRGVSFQ